MKRSEANEYAKSIGIDYKQYSRKSDLCIAILTSELERKSKSPVYTNKKIAEALKMVGLQYKEKGDDWRSRAFMKAQDAILKLKEPLTDPSELLKIKGIGPGTVTRIYEFMLTGELEEIKDFKSLELVNVYGIGLAKAYILKRNGITTYDELVSAYNEGKTCLTKNQLVGLEYYYHFKEKIPRAEVKAVGESIITSAIKIDADTKGEIVGSYRRGAVKSGDIDILITNAVGVNVLSLLVKFYVSELFIVHTLSLGKVKFQGTYFSDYPDSKGTLSKIDIRYVPPENWATSLLHSTGSAAFNIELREYVKKLGGSLSEHALMLKAPSGKLERVEVGTEKDVFDALELDYVPLKNR
uniref:DNA-directed DNA polymerase n=1 Tax=Pithovirus LCDPAC01 TaxID=2506600 RepID=A0A481YN06_9VIRU|nr:MAG: DNA polymerase family X [Pithovirus LCDPAC01]